MTRIFLGITIITTLFLFIIYVSNLILDRDAKNGEEGRSAAEGLTSTSNEIEYTLTISEDLVSNSSRVLGHPIFEKSLKIDNNLNILEQKHKSREAEPEIKDESNVVFTSYFIKFGKLGKGFPHPSNWYYATDFSFFH